MEELFDRYEMKFYKVQQKWYDSKHWGNWKLIIDGVEYPTPYENIEAWQAAMDKNNARRTPEFKNPFTGGVYDEVEKFIKEADEKR